MNFFLRYRLAQNWLLYTQEKGYFLETVIIFIQYCPRDEQYEPAAKQEHSHSYIHIHPTH